MIRQERSRSLIAISEHNMHFFPFTHAHARAHTHARTRTRTRSLTQMAISGLSCAHFPLSALAHMRRRIRVMCDALLACGCAGSGIS